MGLHKKNSFHLKLLMAAAASLGAAQAHAADPFTIKHIRAEGLVRLETGTVLTYMPLGVGDVLDKRSGQQVIRSLYQSGLFDDVSIDRDGDTLVVHLAERPAIASFDIEGNKKVGGDDLKKSLEKAGMAEGELFKRDLLDEVEREFQRQYFSNGYYDVQIKSDVEQLPSNRVRIKITVVEGKPTRIKDINIVGNKAFSDEELLKAFKLRASSAWKLFQSSDKYSKQQLVGDLESLTSYYQDRGYLKFNVTSVQVQLSPDRKDIYVTINVEEGDVYKMTGNEISGDTIIDADRLKFLLSTRPGEIFSRKEATASADRIEAALSDIGYAFAKVEPTPEVDEDKKEVKLNYVVNPGARTYVRHITFSGNSSTNDETLRREMRQLESAPFSKSAVERSRVRLERLPFVESVDVDTQPVPGTEDLVDVAFTIKERPPGSVQFGLGYSGSYGFLLNGSVTHTNFLGTGNRVSFEASTNTIGQSLNVSWTDPYYTADGVQRTIGVFYRKTDSLIRTTSSFSSNIVGGSLTYGIPLSEFASLRAGVAIQDTAINTSSTSSDQVLEFAENNGSHYGTVKLQTGVTWDTRNRTFFANRGSLSSLSLDVTVPGSDLWYYSATYRAEQFVPLPFKFFLDMTGNVGLVDGYGGKHRDVPPYELYFAGGANTVRGYSDGYLGPLDTPYGRPAGGRLRTTSQNDLVLPLPFEANMKSFRSSIFWDIGQVYEHPSDFAASELRQSSGVAVQWYTPFLGLLELSYAIPLNDKVGDHVDRFQINFGGSF